MSNLAALILMGGQNKRMNGKPKAFLSLKDTNFLDSIIFKLNSCHEIYLSVDEIAKYPKLCYPLIEDQFHAIGPIGGIYSALQTIPYEDVFVTACDMPFITDEFVSFLQLHHKPGTCYTVVSDENGHLYPLGGIYNRTILPIIGEMIKAQNYRLTDLIQKANGHIIPLSKTPFDKHLLSNINTPEDYEKLIKTY